MLLHNPNRRQPRCGIKMREVLLKSAKPPSDMAWEQPEGRNAPGVSQTQRKNKEYKEEKIILQINKEEALAMRQQLGEHTVNKTHSKHPSYYIVENPRYLKALEQYRLSKFEKK